MLEHKKFFYRIWAKNRTSSPAGSYAFLLAPVECRQKIQQFRETTRVHPCAPAAICRVNRRSGFIQSILKIDQEFQIQINDEWFDHV
jgi:hypothetical protein